LASDPITGLFANADSVETPTCPYADFGFVAEDEVSSLTGVALAALSIADGVVKLDQAQYDNSLIRVKLKANTGYN